MIVDTAAIKKSLLDLVEGKRHVIKNSIPTLTEEEYKQMHTDFLVPTTIKIDASKIQQQIEPYSKYFMQMLHRTLDLPRYSIPLANLDGTLKEYDDANISFQKLNQLGNDKVYIDSDYNKPTEVFYLPFAEPLRIFENDLYRSLLLYWKPGGLFVPHIDALSTMPIMIRLWMGTESMRLRYAKNNVLVDCDFEPGRVYIIDTSIVHDAHCFNEDGYQLIIALHPRAYDMVNNIKINS